MRTLSSHHAAFLAKFCCSLHRGLSTSILSVTFSASKRKSPTKHSATPDDRQVPSRAVKYDKTFRHSRRSPSAFPRSPVCKNIQPLPTIAKCLLAQSSVKNHSATPDDHQVTSRAVKCCKTFRHSRRSSSAFSRSEQPVKCDETLLHLTLKSTWLNMYCLHINH